MIQNSVQSTISELRDESQEINIDGLFKKSLLGGYNVKQVTEYTESLKEELKDAEEALNDKTREFAAAIAKLTQERDLYGEMFNMCKQSKLELEEQIDSLTKESEKLKRELPLSQDKIKLCDELVVQNKKLEEELGRQKIYEQEYTNLKEQFAKLKLRGEELSNELADYSQYDNIERNYLLAENSTLINRNKRLTVNLSEFSEKNEELKRINSETEFKMNQIITEFESKTAVYALKYQRSIDRISESLKKANETLKYEIADNDHFWGGIFRQNSQ